MVPYDHLTVIHWPHATGLPAGEVPLLLKGLLGYVEHPSFLGYGGKDAVKCGCLPFLWAVLVAVPLTPASRDKESD